MDHCSAIIESIYKQCYPLSPLGENVLGFELNDKFHNFSFLGTAYIYRPTNVNTTTIPGTNICRVSSTKLNRIVMPRNYPPGYCVHIVVNGLGLNVYVMVAYNGNHMFVTDIGVDQEYEQFLQSVSYPLVVLQLYHNITGVKQGLYSYAIESINFIASIDTNKYVPATISYMSLLEKLVDAAINSTSTCINPKYDGMAYWLYASASTPLSLISQCRSRSGVSHKYIGRVSDLPKISENATYAAAVEFVEGRYVITDLFTDNVEAYAERMSRCSQFFNVYMSSTLFAWTSAFPNIVRTNTMRLGNGRTDGENVSIITALSNPLPNTDGYVLYVGNDRPVKIKLASMLTVDVEYNRTTGWNLSNSTLKGIIKDPPIHEMTSETCVFEVRVGDGTVVRERPDRSKGNPGPIIDTIVRSYAKEIKHSQSEVWAGRDIKFSILLNRMFKYYSYRKYVPECSCVVDLGSGNGGDYRIWKLMSYKVLAIEIDPGKVGIMKNKVRGDSNVMAVNDNMLNAIKYMRRSTMKYRVAISMRSISHLEIPSIVDLITSLLNAGINKVVIVTMVADDAINHVYTNDCKQRFAVTLQNGKSTVEYSIEGKTVSYVDNCYTIQQWRDIAVECSLQFTMEHQSEFMFNVYGIEPTKSTMPCFMDVVIVMTSNAVKF